VDDGNNEGTTSKLLLLRAVRYYVCGLYRVFNVWQFQSWRAQRQASALPLPLSTPPPGEVLLCDAASTFAAGSGIGSGRGRQHPSSFFRLDSSSPCTAVSAVDVPEITSIPR
jgi:hypothetical protein